MANVSSSNGLEKRPKLRFPGFDEPWKMVSLQDISEYRKNKICVSKSKYISTENMLQNFAGIIPYTSEEDISGVEFCVGDTLLANIRPYLRKAWLATHDGACSTDVLALCPLDITPAFLNNIIEQDRFIDYVMSGVKGSKMPRGDKAHILAYETAIPSLLEQEKINSFMQLLHQRIAKIQMEIELLKKYKRGLVSQILKQRLAISHEDDEWKEVCLSDVAEGFEYGLNAAATTYDGKHKYIRITDIDDDTHAYINQDPVSPSGAFEERYRVRENDILFARTGASVGKSYLYRKNDGDLFFAGFLIRIHVKEGVDGEYVFLNTLTEEYDKWVLLESARSGQPGINAEQYRKYRFKLPSLNTQRRIATIARNIDVQIQKEALHLRLLQKQKAGLLQQLFI